MSGRTELNGLAANPMRAEQHLEKAARNFSPSGEYALQLEIRHDPLIAGIEDVWDMNLLSRFVSPYLRSCCG